VMASPGGCMVNIIIIVDSFSQEIGAWPCRKHQAGKEI
jgi:hypothetical protein